MIINLPEETTYDIEVDHQDHLFVLANGLIVSNCHRMGGVKFASVINQLNARHRMGLTGTVERCDYHEKFYSEVIGPVVAHGKSRKVPCKVTVIKTRVDIEFKNHEPFPYVHKRIYNNKDRMNIVLEYLEKDIEDGDFICFAFHPYSIKQLERFTEKLKSFGWSAKAFYGQMSEDRKTVLSQFVSGEVQVAVCNRQMLTGIDVPRWNCYYNVFPSSNVRFNELGQLSGNYYQEFSRVRTVFKYPETGVVKTEAKIRDFLDNNRFCFATFNKRMKAYENQEFPVEFIDVGKGVSYDY